jgi:hypothetical protein
MINPSPLLIVMAEVAKLMKIPTTPLVSTIHEIPKYPMIWASKPPWPSKLPCASVTRVLALPLSLTRQ